MVRPYPAFVPESVVICVVAVEINVEPILVGGVPLLLLHILECPEASAYMVEYTVQYDLHTVFMETLAYVCKVIVRSETAVDLFEIPGIVAVIVRFEDWIQKDRIYAKIP